MTRKLDIRRNDVWTFDADVYSLNFRGLGLFNPWFILLLPAAACRLLRCPLHCGKRSKRGSIQARIRRVCGTSTAFNSVFPDYNLEIGCFISRHSLELRYSGLLHTFLNSLPAPCVLPVRLCIHSGGINHQNLWPRFYFSPHWNVILRIRRN